MDLLVWWKLTLDNVFDNLWVQFTRHNTTRWMEPWISVDFDKPNGEIIHDHKIGTVHLEAVFPVHHVVL